MENNKNIRESWIDNIKVVACVLVLLGHFFQSMVKSGIIEKNDIYLWFNTTIYYFHVPLFFICSGYIYQRYSVVDSAGTWINNIVKKLVNLGIPYFTFSIITYLIKVVLSSSVNSKNTGLIDSLFVHPASPYWFLYTLFFIFVLIPTFKNDRMMYFFAGTSLILRVVVDLAGDNFFPYLCDKIMTFTIWFVVGMILSRVNVVSMFSEDASKDRVLKKYGKIIAGFVMILFLAISVLVYVLDFNNGLIPFICGIIACAGVIIFFAGDTYKNYFGIFSKYTMPVFLMHTIFAAGIRIVLNKMGMNSLLIQSIVGIPFSIIGPVISAMIMEKLFYPEIFINPGKFIRININGAKNESVNGK
ncbi:MAG: acyltransferase [Lachnospiraceae bacterium]|nr:acyltransferase [Lachnospiraceae bacterium]